MADRRRDARRPRCASRLAAARGPAESVHSFALEVKQWQPSYQVGDRVVLGQPGARAATGTVTEVQADVQLMTIAWDNGPRVLNWDDGHGGLYRTANRHIRKADR